MRGFILSVGDELVNGLAVDTNSAWLSRELAGEGVVTLGHSTVGDDQRVIEEAIRAQVLRPDLLLITGGLGPTPDDLTREALAEVMDVAMVEDSGWIAHLVDFFDKRGRVMQPGNRKQALIPRSATLLWNPIGTAAGIAADVARDEGVCRVYVFPGVPAEMKAMFEQHVRPWVRKEVTRRGGQVMQTLSLHTFGVGESDLTARLGDVLRRRAESEGLQVGTTASGGIVSIRAYAAGATEAEAQEKLAAVENDSRQKLGAIIFGRDGETLAEVVGRRLRGHPRQPLLRVAESCTGGLLGKLITDVAGSSDYFDRGWITYANEAKTELLGVPADMIARHGAVSEEVASAMAMGALSMRLPDGRGGIALSVSGVAGPGGGTAQKPVGMVCIGLAACGLAHEEQQVSDAGGSAPIGGDAGALHARKPVVTARTFHFVGDRDLIRHRSAMMALAMLRYHLMAEEMPF